MWVQHSIYLAGCHWGIHSVEFFTDAAKGPVLGGRATSKLHPGHSKGPPYDIELIRLGLKKDSQSTLNKGV